MYTGSFPFFLISREFDSINCSENFFVNAYTQRLSTIIHIFIESWDNICIFFLFKTIIWFDGPENNEETAVFDLVSVSWHHLCFNTTPGFLGLFNFFFCLHVVGEFSYLLKLPVLRDCIGPHSSLPALGTAEGVLHTHTHNIHTSGFKVLLNWLCKRKRKVGWIPSRYC